MQTPNVIELQVKDYVRILSRQRLLVSVVVVVAVVAAIVITRLQVPKYTASVDIFIELEQASDAVTGTSAGRVDQKRLLENEIGFLESRLVFDEVTRRLGREPDIQARASADRDFLTVVATDLEPEEAVITANTYADTYLELRRRSALDDLVATSEVVQGQVDELDDDIRAIDAEMDAELDALDAAFAQELEESEPGQRPRSGDELLNERREIERRYEELRQPLTSQRLIFVQYLTTAQLNSDLTSGSVGRIMSRARLPEGPSSPKPLRNVALGLILGFVAGAAAAVLRQTMNDTVDDGARETGYIEGLPVVGSIPSFPRKLHNQVVSIADPTSVGAEAYRSLRTAVVFAATTADRRVLQVTSASPSEGKSETSTNLAVSLAQAGKRVVLIDADLRRPTLDRRLGKPKYLHGLSSVLSGSHEVGQCLVSVDDVPSLSFLPAGPMPVDPAALLDSERLDQLVDQLRRQYEFVIVDSPPVGVVSDPLTLSSQADGVIIVARAERTKRRDLRAAVSALRQVEADLFGLVLNGVKAGRSYRYRYYGDRDRMAKAVRPGPNRADPNGPGPRDRRQSSLAAAGDRRP